MNNTFGERLRTLRLTHNLTVDQLSEMIDVSPSFLGLVERNNRMFSWRNKIIISELFSVSLDYLLLGRDNANSELLTYITRQSCLDEDEKHFVSLMAHLAKMLNGEEHKLVFDFLFEMFKLLSTLRNNVAQ